MTTPFLIRALFRSSRDPCVRSRPSSDKAEAFAGDSELGDMFSLARQVRLRPEGVMEARRQDAAHRGLVAQEAPRDQNAAWARPRG